MRSLVLMLLGSSVLRAWQEPAKEAPQPPQGIPKNEVPPPGLDARADLEKKFRENEAALDKMFEAYDLKPHGLPAIPDDPPPHEGAMIDYPIVIEPPDLLLVEVLEALPGRPISGERLVRPDGKISLGFYGEVHVAGLTVEQAKVKIIKHLRKALTDEGLGLYETVIEEEARRSRSSASCGREALAGRIRRRPENKVKKTGQAVPARPVRSVQRTPERRVG